MFLISFIELFASSLVAVFPVPIAHIGSYAIIVFSTCSAVKPCNASSVCFVMTSVVFPDSLCSNVSPTHTIGFNPYSNADFIFLFTVSSVSLKYCLLSECPIITYSTFIDFNFFGETSPVYAPFYSKCIFSAPIFIFVSCAVSKL